MIKPEQIIACSRFAEFPDVLVTLQLCRAMAIRDKRSVPQSIRACGRVLIPRIQHPLLKATIEEMSTSPFPEVQISRIKDCLRKMETALVRSHRQLTDS